MTPTDARSRPRTLRANRSSYISIPRTTPRAAQPRPARCATVLRNCARWAMSLSASARTLPRATSSLPRNIRCPSSSSAMNRPKSIRPSGYGRRKNGRTRVHGYRAHHFHHRRRPPHHAHHHKSRHQRFGRPNNETAGLRHISWSLYCYPIKHLLIS